MRSVPVPIVCLTLGLGWTRWEGEAHLTTSNDEALEVIPKPLSPQGRGWERGEIAGEFDPPPTPPCQGGEFWDRF